MKNHQNKLTIILFTIYLIFLTWIILFKMQFDTNALPYIRSINLIPFGESVIVNGKIYVSEIIDNLLIFIPVGMYIEILAKNQKFYKKIIPILYITLFLEISQYIFHIGATDITDIIMNTSGGIIGILAISILYKIFKNPKKVNKILNILALICTALLMAFLFILIAVN